MPLYEYRCTSCGYKFEKIQKFSDAPEQVCPKCQGELVRPVTAPALKFEGAGWYINDYAPKAGASASDRDSKAGETKSGETKSEGSDSKTADSGAASSAPASPAAGSASSSTSGAGSSGSSASGSPGAGSSGSGSAGSGSPTSAS